MSDRTGQQLGNYRLIRLLGSGSFAEVYLGEQIYLETLAAIKVMGVEMAPNEQDLFLQEARTIARLSHPNIVRRLDFGRSPGRRLVPRRYALGLGQLRRHRPTVERSK